MNSPKISDLDLTDRYQFKIIYLKKFLIPIPWDGMMGGKSTDWVRENCHCTVLTEVGKLYTKACYAYVGLWLALTVRMPLVWWFHSVWSLHVVPMSTLLFWFTNHMLLGLE